MRVCFATHHASANRPTLSFLPRLTPVANGGSFFENAVCCRGAGLARAPVPIGQRFSSRGNRPTLLEGQINSFPFVAKKKPPQREERLWPDCSKLHCRCCLGVAVFATFVFPLAA
jgi:hypothetical protein